MMDTIIVAAAAVWAVGVPISFGASMALVDDDKDLIAGALFFSTIWPLFWPAVLLSNAANHMTKWAMKRWPERAA